MEIKQAERNIFGIPPFHYFKEGNKFSGSRDKIFRYKAVPGEKLSCTVWHKDIAIDCLDEADIVAVQEFSLDEQGRREMIDWLMGQYDDFAAKHSQALHAAHSDI